MRPPWMSRRDVLRAAAGAGLGAAGCHREATPLARVCAEPGPPKVTAKVDARWERVVRAFEGSLEGWAAPGGAIGVVLDGKVAFTAGRGVRKIGTTAPVTTSTLFRLESVTKTFTALAALSLVEKKTLDLAAPIADLVPSVSFREAAAGREVTLRRLLTHTAGLSRNAIVRLLDVRRGTEWEDLFQKNPLTLGPVGTFEYSNTGYLLVGAAIERAARRSYDELARELVTKPLGMLTATNDGAVAAKLEHADGFGLDEQGRDHSYDPTSLDPYVQRPVGGLHASIDELALFASRLAAGVPEVLRRETFEDMTRSQTATSEAGVWYGYGIYGLDSPLGPVWTHTGGGRGGTAYFVCAPRQRFAFALATNASRYGGWRDMRRAAEEAFLGAPLF